MPFRRSRFPARGRGPRRSTDWIGSAVRSTTVALAANTAILDQSFALAEPGTIVRVRGDLWIGTDQGAASENPFGALGFSLVKEQASTIGITALPLPYTDLNDDSFFVLQPWASRIRFLSGVGFDHRVFDHYVIDSKAQRKFVQGDEVVVTLENADATGAAIFILTFRMLVMLHG